LTNIRSLFAAGAVLLLWAVAPLVAIWLNSPPRQQEGPLTTEDRLFLQQQALHIWRYFHEFGDEKNHWLIPDNVEEKDTFQIRKVSPTNLGMLLNARQAACEFGFLTLPEFAAATLGTLNTYDRLEKQRGHIYNWYDLETLQPIAPLIVSTVDSGNLTASLYTLHTGALDLLKRPLLTAEMFSNLVQIQPRSTITVTEATATTAQHAKDQAIAKIRAHVRALLQQTAAPDLSIPIENDLSGTNRGDWLVHELSRRHLNLSIFVQNYLPWFLPQFEALFALPELSEAEARCLPTLQQAANCATELESRIAVALPSLPPDSPLAASAESFRCLLADAAQRLTQLKTDIATIAFEAERHADAMQYGFLFVESRQLLSIGYDGASHELHSACYDLLASEARIASFIAVAKGDIPQQSWFRLDRSHVLVDGHPALLSWTGTMFEYTMPALWMRTFPNTLIARTLESAVRIQRNHVKNVPWGISESGFAKMDPQGRYSYQAWGIPALALKYGAEDGPVISPYSTFLSLAMSRKEALANLRRMAAMDWMGNFGFYEAADYTEGSQPELVRSWMAHHQGMCLLAITNLLKDNIVQHWFHSTPRVRAAELLLHEKPLSKETLKELSNQSKSQQTE
jgi:cyclic beta-1,2-glucan synthetase